MPRDQTTRNSELNFPEIIETTETQLSQNLDGLLECSENIARATKEIVVPHSLADKGKDFKAALLEYAKELRTFCTRSIGDLKAHKSCT